MSKVPAHYELISEIIQLRARISPSTKLIINGDIKDQRQISELSQSYPEVDGFMIGRGIFQNPYCFTNHTPTKDDLLTLFRYHLNQYDARAKEIEHYPYEPLKRFFKIYINSFDGASDLRVKLMDCKNTTELRQVLDDYEQV